MKRILPIASILFIASTVQAEPAPSDVLMTALTDELARSSSLQLNGMQKPFYASFSLNDLQEVAVDASLGAIVTDNGSRHRSLESGVRVGDYTKDSSRLGDDMPWRSRYAGHRQTSLDDRYDDIRHEAWLSLDTSYKSALDAFAKKNAILAGQSAPPGRVDDFSHEPAAVLLDAHVPKAFDHDRAVRLARTLSGVSIGVTGLQGSSSSVQSTALRAYFVSSEGTRIVEPRYGVSVATVLRTQAADGMQLSTFRSVAACSPDTLPSDDALIADARQAATELDEIRSAPLVEDYSGPILFEGIAAPELLYNTLAGSLGGTPPETASEQSFRTRTESPFVGQVGQRVLPAGFRVEDDPTIDRLGGAPLAGCYKFDDEGVAAQKVTLIEDGVLKNFLMSRTPREGFLHSNGHGRATWEGVEGSIANLTLSASKGLSAKDLRARLITEAKAQKKPYALVIERLSDPWLYDVDMSLSDRFGQRTRGTNILVMWKLGLDGKATRVRGGELPPVTLRALKDIIAAGSVPAISSQSAAAYGGRGGHSVASPALLFKELDLKRQREGRKLPPIVPRPE